jgi:hypothetical protein
MKLLFLVVSWAIAGVLMVSAFAHLNNPYFFLSTVHSYQILPQRLGTFVAFILPWFQLAIAIGLLWGQQFRFSAYAYSTFLFFVFTGAQIYTFARDLNIDCGCFSNSENNPIGYTSIFRSAALALVSLIGTFLIKYRTSKLS